jgi:hypothetical protein
MGKDKGRDKGGKIRAQRALAEAEMRARADAGDPEVAGTVPINVKKRTATTAAFSLKKSKSR